MLPKVMVTFPIGWVDLISLPCLVSKAFAKQINAKCLASYFIMTYK